jgi:hypothetical protein
MIKEESTCAPLSTFLMICHTDFERQDAQLTGRLAFFAKMKTEPGF